jgi:hypothetical protein
MKLGRSDDVGGAAVGLSVSDARGSGAAKRANPSAAKGILAIDGCSVDAKLGDETDEAAMDEEQKALSSEKKK